MSAPKAIETPVSEKIQARTAFEMFEKGMTIRKDSRDQFMADQRRSNAGLNRSELGAASAEAGAERLKSQRKAKTSKLAQSNNIRGDSAGIAALDESGKNYSPSQHTIGSSVNQLSSTGRYLAAKGNADALASFERSNQRTQAAIDTAVAAGSWYARQDSSATKAGKASGNSQVSIGGGMYQMPTMNKINSSIGTKG